MSSQIGEPSSDTPMDTNNSDPLASQVEPSSNARGRTPPHSTDLLFSAPSSQADIARAQRRGNTRRNDIGLNGITQYFGTQSDVLGESQIDEQQMESSQMDIGDKVRVVWGTTVVISETIAAFKNFLNDFTPAHRKNFEGIAPNGSDDMIPLYPKLLQQIHDTEVFNLNLDCLNLKSYQPTSTTFYELIKYPQEVIPMMDMVVNEMYQERFPDSDFDPIQIRPFNLGSVVNMRNLDPSDIDQLVTIKGLVIRSSNIIPDMRSAFFRCSVCNHALEVENIKGKIQEPSRCPRQDCEALHSLVLVHNQCRFNDKQILRVQETPDAIPDGQTPHTITSCVYDALVDVSRPGDRVEITGIFRAAPVRVMARQRKVRNLFRTFIDVVHIKRRDESRLKLDKDEMNAEEYMVNFDEADDVRSEEDSRVAELIEMSQQKDIYDRLTFSLAPNVWEMDNVKKGLLLQLFGGVTKTVKKCGNVRFRGDINILLAGDPGVSKSQLLQYVHKIAPRGIYTSGKGSSAVGLTAYVTRDPETKQFVLESGALVLSDGGVCCIDEFDKMSDATRAILHEVMEQQTVSVAKAGIITTLNARTSILASANPVDSKYNQKRSIVDNLNLPPSLLSRFDLICLILDKADEALDKKLGEHIVSLYLEDSSRPVYDIIETKLLTRYISYGRSLSPELSDEAVNEITSGYVDMRQMNRNGKTVSATTRQLEAMIRLSEAHAKMRFSSIVEKQDVDEARRLIDEAIHTYAIDPVTGLIDMDMINTGKSSAVREQMADLKRAVKDFLSKVSSSTDFNSLMNAISSQSSIPVNEKWLRDVVIELSDEEFIHVTGNVRKGNATIRRLI